MSPCIVYKLCVNFKLCVSLDEEREREILIAFKLLELWSHVYRYKESSCLPTQKLERWFSTLSVSVLSGIPSFSLHDGTVVSQKYAHGR